MLLRDDAALFLKGNTPRSDFQGSCGVAPCSWTRRTHVWGAMKQDDCTPGLAAGRYVALGPLLLLQAACYAGSGQAVGSTGVGGSTRPLMEKTCMPLNIAGEIV